MKVISIGDLVTDFYYQNDKLVGANGGMTSHNIIANIAKLGLETMVFGACGKDKAGIISVNSLKELGVDVSHIKYIDELDTRCFYVSYRTEADKLIFSSKKRCPLCNQKRWYEESQIDTKDILDSINDNDILVFDNLNSQNQIVIDGCNNKKMLDLGQYFELDKYNDTELLAKINNKFEIINLNERVEKYLKNRFSIKALEELNNIFHSKMIIITRGKNGADFILDNIKITKKLGIKSKEIDPTGAGDAFFSVFIYEYVKNGGVINNDFIDLAFDKATKLTNKVVKAFGARGHIQKLYKIKKIDEGCVCQNFDIITRKQIKRCNININNLEKRVINALNSNAYNKISKIKFQELNNVVFTGTGGSFAGAKFSAKVINQLYGINAIALYPRDLYYRNNQKVDKLFLFTYSGTTNDLLVSSQAINNKNKYIITKGELQKVVMKTGISKNNVITYRSGTNKGKERGFLSFEGALVPATLFLELYFQNNNTDLNVINFVHDSISYWRNYFSKIFNDNKKELKKFLKVGNNFNIFSGDFTESAGVDFESKIIESGIFNCIVHEKKNFSHGRFVNYEHLNKGKNIYFKQKTTSVYEEKLLDYLHNEDCLIIESRFDGILCEYDLLVASQYLIYFISNFLNMDISKPTYSDDAMKIYFYKGEL